MLQTLRAGDLTLHQIKAKFGLKEASEQSFFSEWQEGLVESDLFTLRRQRNDLYPVLQILNAIENAASPTEPAVLLHPSCEEII